MSATPATPLFALHDIGKDYAAPVLDGVTLTLEAGEVLALTGENGAGKSTLSKIVCGLVTPTRGTMLLGARRSSRARAATPRRTACAW